MNRIRRLPRWALALFVLLLALVLGISVTTPRTAPKEMYVAVMEDSTDAAVTKTPDRFGEVLAVVKFNEKVEIIRDLWEDKDNPRPYFHIKVRGVKGYIKRNALAEKSQYQGDPKDAEAKVAVGAAGANTAAKGLNSQNEATLRKNDPNFDKAVSQVDATEAAVNELIYGSPKDVDARKGLDSYRAWGDEGQNIAKETSSGGGQ
ncbi:MAG: hypothetical protein HS108_08735 [Planctomycetes bacterium]|jgi:hypothetical protein|nr:hypothetical protein [Planctomycetota bacterium]MCL4729943.1 hypothetical protein [Planctomycetota bacterium]